VTNEYLEAFKKSQGYNPHTFLPRVDRSKLCQEYSWAIPDDEALDIIAKYGPIVEIGAGGGYWAHLLRERGVDVLAYDCCPGSNLWVKRSWAAVRVGGPEKAAKLPQRTLFLCWPPYDEPMAAECLKAYRGNKVIYIGEDGWGCTGDQEFHEILGRDWEQIEYHCIPTWDGIHDGLTVYRRRA
jgi:hypothetical protein